MIRLKRCLPYLCLAAVAVVAKTAVEERHVPAPPPAVSAPALPHLALQLGSFGLGLDLAMAGMLWVDLLQRADTTPIPEGTVSWESSQINAVTTLDPNFERAYPYGAALLSVFRADRLGAKHHLQKWTVRRPGYWRSHYLLGYHLYFEMNDFDEAARHIQRASEMAGAPGWLGALGVRLLSESGRHSQALRTAVELYGTIPDPEGRRRLLLRIRDLRVQLEGTEWEEALALYRHRLRQDPPNTSALLPYLKEAKRNPATDEISRIEIPSDATPELVASLAEPIPFRYDFTHRAIRVSGMTAEEKSNPLGIHRPRQAPRGQE